MNRPISTLNLPEYKINEFFNKGYIFCEDVNIETIKSEVGVTAEEWEKLTKSIETKTALDLCEDEIISGHIVTFSSALDEILGGGVPVKMITEFCGLPGSGKTQLCLQLCVSIQIPDCFGGINGQAIFIDTNLGFTPKRLSDMAKGCIKYCQKVAEHHNSFEMFENLKTLSEENILSGVNYIKAVNLIELLSIGNLLPKFLMKNSNIKLVVIDSITNAMKNSNLENFEKTKLIYSFLSDLQKLANKYKFAIVVTNDMTTKFDENGESYETPCLGETFAHRMNSRILLERISNTVFNATVMKSVLQPQVNSKFQIIEAGIRDTK